MKSRPVVNKDMRKSIKQESRKQVQAYMGNYNTEINVIICMALRNAFGFGKKRLERFLDSCDEIQQYFGNRYEEADVFVMNRELIKIGVNIPARFKDELSKDSVYYEDSISVIHKI